MSQRSKLLSYKRPHHEQELHIITNPHASAQLRLLDNDDYQAPLTARTLASNSKWLIVRNNIHKIRSWGGIDASHVEQQFRDWYIFFQTRRELRHVQKYIKQLERSAFVPVRYFDLPLDERHRRRYNVSHVQPSDALFHPGFGAEPVVLQSLLYYFSKECFVPHNSVFRPFLADVCSILYQDRQRLNRAAVFRKVALVIAIIIFIIIGLMLFSMILSVLKTTSNLHDMYRSDSNGDIQWREPPTTSSFL